ncbi:MAG: tRNA pseudouridine(38-40) synthase TruA [Saprospiraceae bacterium]|nr:tRNA pseudouridine(38-40) synthase TruA [Saprospiraceae bacterium]
MQARYFAESAYLGKAYCGWQKQPGQISVQSVIEGALQTILGQETEITGCGRTDSGVHAKQYFFHFDFPGSFPDGFLRRINKFLPPDIAIRRIIPVADDAHARFHATHRAYEYHLTMHKDPFSQETAYFYPYALRPDFKKLQEAATLLLDYQEFFPFCKTNTDVKTMECNLVRSEWKQSGDEQELVFHIAANRFLRGMVRLIVGMCVNVATSKLDLESVKIALDKQIRLEKSWSVPPEGLFLTDIRYPFILL